MPWASELNSEAIEGGEVGEAPQLEGGEAAGASELNSEAGGGVDEGSEPDVARQI